MQGRSGRGPRFKEWIQFGVVTLIILPAIAYSGLRSSWSFWDGAVANFVATLLGVVLGIPVALWFERRRSKQETEEKTRAIREQRKAVFTLVLDEMRVNVERLEARVQLPPDLIATDTLGTAAWGALAASGHLSSIDDVGVLADFSEGYSLLSQLARREELLYERLRGATVQFGPGQTAHSMIHDDLRRQYPHALKRAKDLVGRANAALREELAGGSG